MREGDDPMGKTIAEKILSSHSDRDARAKDVVLADVDLLMGHDWNTPLTIDVLRQMGVEKISAPERTVFVIDHAVPSPSERISNMQEITERFAESQGAHIYHSGDGICHQLLPEQGHVVPGMVVVGCDSHSTTYGALNTMSVGVGSSDLAAALASGKLWFRVPETIKVALKGKLPNGTYAKDFILSLIGKVGAEAANYMAVEFTGEGAASLTIDARFTICNMAVEMGAKCAIFQIDDQTETWLSSRVKSAWEPVFPDTDAVYVGSWDWDLSTVLPTVARPHDVDKTCAVTEAEGTEVSEGVLGTCTNGRLEDLRIAATLLKGKKIRSGFRLIVVPASRRILIEAAREGIVETLVEAGAMVIPPGCGPCHGASNGVPRDGENCISTANRNFRGRMGNNKAAVYLASPATVAASALNGKITDPRRYME
jgi:3-isopropylmalate/(R)-2-methylmalate dehydratase large subunit